MLKRLRIRLIAWRPKYQQSSTIFSINRVDVETATNSLDSLKAQISTKFNTTGLSNEQFVNRVTELYIYC